MALIRPIPSKATVIDSYEMVRIAGEAGRLTTYLSSDQLKDFTQIRVVKNSYETSSNCYVTALADNNYVISGSGSTLTDGTWTDLSTIISSSTPNLGLTSGSISSTATIHWTVELR